MQLTSGPGRPFRGGIFSTADPDARYGSVNARAFSDGVLGAIVPMQSGQGRAYADGVLARIKPSAAYQGHLTAYADGSLGAFQQIGTRPGVFRGGVLDTPFPMRAYSDGSLGLLDTLSNTQKVALGAAGLGLGVLLVYKATKRKR